MFFKIQSCTCFYFMFGSFFAQGLPSTFFFFFFTLNQLTQCVMCIMNFFGSSKHNRLGSFTVHCLSCSVFYVFYEQYLTIVKDTWQNLLYCAGKFLLVLFFNTVKPPVVTTSPQQPVFQNIKSCHDKSSHYIWNPF